MSGKTKVMVVVGTRPEAIKMAPVIRALEHHPDQFAVVRCVSGQHREMLDQVLDLFAITPDYSLDVMRENQTLPGLTSRLMERLDAVYRKEKPDLVLVHGDTTTALVGALAALALASVLRGKLWLERRIFPGCQCHLPDVGKMVDMNEISAVGRNGE